MNEKARAALIGGVVMGVLSGVPFVNLGNVCCCMWGILGGAMASYIFIKRSPTPVTPGEGAVLGLMCGLIGTVVSWVIGIPLFFVVGDVFSPFVGKFLESMDPRAAEDFRRQMAIEQNKPFLEKIPGMMAGMGMGLVGYAAFATVGGLLSVIAFEKRKAGVTPLSTPPPPPGGYGGSSY